MKNLENRVALVTGAGRGIGKAVAVKLAQEGAKVVVNDLDLDCATSVVLEIEKTNGTATALAGSVTDSGFAQRFIDTALDKYGDIDIVVNNAGFPWDGVIQKMKDEQWNAVIDVHLTAPFRILREVQKHFKKFASAEREAGKEKFRKVVNISSVAGLGGNAGQVNYASAKAGVVGLTKTLAKEWGRYNVNVNAVAFGYISTRLTEARDDDSSVNIDGNDVRLGIRSEVLDSVDSSIPLGRPGTAEEAAGAVYMLCSPESNYVSGQILVCGGGFEM